MSEYEDNISESSFHTAICEETEEEVEEEVEEEIKKIQKNMQIIK